MAYLSTLFIGLCGSFLFYLLKLPIPWLLGSLVFVFIFQFFSKIPMKWDIRFRNYGLMVVGFSIGHIFTLEILKNILSLFPFILMSNILLILFSILMAYFLHLASKVDFPTMLVANVPGGISQMILFAEETNRLNVPIVTYFQVLRVFLVVLTIPFIVTLHSSGNVPIESATTVQAIDLLWLILFFSVSPIAVKIAMKLYIPVPYFVGPLIYMLILSLFEIQVPKTPDSIVYIAQLCIGSYIGLILKREAIQFSTKIAFLGIASTAILISFTYVLSLPLHVWLNESATSVFLGLAPGGLDQMGVVAASMNENVALVTVFQLFRMLFIFLVVVPLLKVFNKNVLSKQDEIKYEPPVKKMNEEKNETPVEPTTAE